jgi:hypothetical protein
MWADTDCVMSTQETQADDTEAVDTVDETEAASSREYEEDDVMVRYYEDRHV